MSAQAEEMDSVVNELLSITGIGRISRKYMVKHEELKEEYHKVKTEAVKTVKPDLKAVAKIIRKETGSKRFVTPRKSNRNRSYRWMKTILMIFKMPDA